VIEQWPLDAFDLASQRCIVTSERSGLQTRIATTGSVFVVRADEKLTAFLELESVIRGKQNWLD
jgi:hypothetical protein